MLLRLTAALAILTVGLTLLAARTAALNELAAQHELLGTTARATLPAIAAAMRRDDGSLADTLAPLVALEGLGALQVRDARGLGHFLHERTTPPPGTLTHLLLGNAGEVSSLRLALDGDGGHLAIRLALTPVDRRVTQVLAAGVAGGGIMAVAILALLYAGLGRVSATLRRLALKAHEIARGQALADEPPSANRYRELEELERAFADGCAKVRHYVQSLEETRDLLDHSRERLHRLVKGMREILFELDPQGRLRFLNPAWQTLTGFDVEASLGRRLGDFLFDADAAALFEPQWLAALSESGREIALRTACGQRRWMSLAAEAQFDDGQCLTGVIGTLSDVTRSVELARLLQRYQEELYQLSVTDPLTGLYNRRHFDSQLEIILAEHLARRRSVCLLLIDLDGFKAINDTYGHPRGDEVLRTMARVLRGEVRRNDYVARMAGDEFAMVLKNTDLATATRIARKLHARIAETRVALPVGYMQLQVSIGIAEAPTHGRNAQQLVSAADVALYHSKRHGRNRIEALAPDVSQALISIFGQGFRLRQALDQGNISPAFQPIYDMRDGRPLAYEVLARMRLEDGIVAAKDFIALAEELGLTRDVDLHIIRQALAVTPAHQALFLNVDLTSFHDPEFVDELAELLAPACRDGRAITIEITERETIPLSDSLERDLARLRALGCKLALDDFGSGYSTYEFLNRFRPDYLKIEGSFVRGMVRNEADRKIVRHIHELAQAFGMETIAESVEDEATQAALREIGIRNAQGLLYGPPVLAGP